MSKKSSVIPKPVKRATSKVGGAIKRKWKGEHMCWYCRTRPATEWSNRKHVCGKCHTGNEKAGGGKSYQLAERPRSSSR
jgi:hypothetical protein